jgi:hypothetical protein
VRGKYVTKKWFSLCGPVRSHCQLGALLNAQMLTHLLLQRSASTFPVQVGIPTILYTVMTVQITAVYVKVFWPYGTVTDCTIYRKIQYIQFIERHSERVGEFYSNQMAFSQLSEPLYTFRSHFGISLAAPHRVWIQPYCNRITVTILWFCTVTVGIPECEFRLH